MITEEDEKTLKNVQEIIDKIPEKQLSLHESVEMFNTIQKAIDNLKIAKYSYREISEEDEKENYFTANCQYCEWFGSSKLLNGGGAIGMTGDYDDCRCPVCDSANVD